MPPKNRLRKLIQGAANLLGSIWVLSVGVGFSASPNNQAPSAESPCTLVSSPAFVDSIPPEYPAIARKAKTEGVVVLQALIDSNGDLVEYQVVSGVNSVLNKAAITALRKSKFKPAVKGGVNVPWTLQVSYPFYLSHNYGEKERRERPPIDWKSPLISEVGKLVEDRGSVESSVFEYDNFRFYGDISVSLYYEVLVEVEPHLSRGERILSFHHHLAFRDMGEMRAMEVSDLSVHTCTEPWAEDCVKGCIYKFANSGGNYSILYQKGRITTWQH